MANTDIGLIAKKSLRDKENRRIVIMEKYFDFMFEELLKQSNLTSAEEKADLIDYLLPVIFSNPNWFEQDRRLQKLADATGISKDQLRMIAGSWSRKQMRRVYPEVESVFAIASEDPLEKRAALENGGDDSGSAEYIGNVMQQALETNRRLRELFNANG